MSNVCSDGEPLRHRAVHSMRVPNVITGTLLQGRRRSELLRILVRVLTSGQLIT